MKITKKEVEYVAQLARLELTPQDTEKFTGQLDEILGYFDKLNQLDTSGIEPTSHAVPMDNAFREDVVKPSMDHQTALDNAPSKEDGFFKVPKIIE